MRARSWCALAAVDPSPEEARRWAEEELAKSAYQEPWIARFLAYLAHQLEALLLKLFSFKGGSSPVPSAVTILAVLVVVLALTVLFVKVWKRKYPDAEEAGSPEPAVLPFAPLTAAEYRARAQAALPDDPRTAAVEAYRAIAAGLQERYVVNVNQGRTAREFAVQAAVAYPVCGVECGDAATTFEEACYGGLVPELSAVERILSLESRMRAEKPILNRPDANAVPLAVPR
ncbi:DUF4129 domain-containing protein [Austwickia chelonae]|uniref:DUF4129 domain-containing protein n=1 Tax=Austwickia chelonae TaxID=100225 RepID=UPI000E250451|nr:DUF4129 domain-containing protein [Austwickia chelonae]